MPSELTEPTLEELSAYIDGELDQATRERIEQHLATCVDCRTRVDGLRETVYAVRALPMESPPRSFSIPKQRTRSWTWAPVGWLGAAAAAVLVIIVGAHQLGTPGSTTASTGTALFAPAQAPKSVNSQASPPAAAGAASQDRSAFAPAASSNQITIVDPRDSARLLNVMSDAKAYAANGTIVVTGHVQSDSPVKVDQIRLVLRRGSYGVQLSEPSTTSSSATQLTFQGSYPIAALALANPRAGKYTLTVTWSATDGTGATLIAELPITIQ